MNEAKEEIVMSTTEQEDVVSVPNIKNKRTIPNNLSSQFQLSNETREDRFPRIFKAISKYSGFNPTEKFSILSFGCSTGEECFSLRKYYPNAKILGYDLNRWNISSAIAKRNERNLDNILFSSSLKEESKFDVVVSLMVFFSIHEPIKKENFDKALESLCQKVKQNGICVLHGLEYSFESTPSFEKDFIPLKSWTHKNNRNEIKDKLYYGGFFKKK